MRVLVIDTQALALDFCLRCMEDGHQVKWSFLRTEKTKNIGKGLVEIVPDWRDWMRWADLVLLADNTKYLKELDVWRRDRGSKIVGASEEASLWELNRMQGMAVFKKAGIAVPPYREFKDYDAAIAYVKHEARRFVSKPIGDEPDKSLSYCAKSPADLVYMLERWRKAKKLKGSFMLQEFISGTEMAVGAWFGAHGFSEGWCENWEEKQLMAGGCGPNTGEMGTTVRYVKRSKLASKVLAPLEPQLQKLGYCGYVDVNCIIDEKGEPWPLEFTMRPGWPTFNIQQALLKGDHAEWLACLSEGRDARPWLLNKLACGVVMAIPDFPYSHITRKEVTGIPVYGMAKVRGRLHPCEMMAGEAPHDLKETVVNLPCMVTAGDYVLVATGTGETVTEARRAAYRVLKQIKAPASPFFRPDIGERLKKELPVIQPLGYATNMKY